MVEETAEALGNNNHMPDQSAPSPSTPARPAAASTSEGNVDTELATEDTTIQVMCNLRSQVGLPHLCQPAGLAPHHQTRDRAS